MVVRMNELRLEDVWVNSKGGSSRLFTPVGVYVLIHHHIFISESDFAILFGEESVHSLPSAHKKTIKRPHRPA